MRKYLLGAAALLTLAGCAGPGYVGGGAMAGYDGFYDDYYGPIYDGYWGDGGVFFYRSHPHGRYIRDGGGHFRHDAVNGFHSMHVNGPVFHGDGAHRRGHH